MPKARFRKPFFKRFIYYIMNIIVRNAKIALEMALDTQKAVFKKVRNSKLMNEKGCVSPQSILNNELGLKQCAKRKNRTNGVIK